MIGNGILAAPLVLNFSERVGHVAQLEQKNTSPPVASAIRSSTLSPLPFIQEMSVLMVYAIACERSAPFGKSPLFAGYVALVVLAVRVLAK